MISLQNITGAPLFAQPLREEGDGEHISPLSDPLGIFSQQVHLNQKDSDPTLLLGLDEEDVPVLVGGNNTPVRRSSRKSNMAADRSSMAADQGWKSMSSSH